MMSSMPSDVGELIGSFIEILLRFVSFMNSAFGHASHLLVPFFLQVSGVVDRR